MHLALDSAGLADRRFHAPSLAATALRRALEPASAAVPQHTSCATCGLDLPAGSPAVPDAFTEAFADDRAFVAHTGWVCRGCDACTTKAAMDMLGNTLCTPAGAFHIATDAQRAFLLTAPLEGPYAPPFVVTISNRQTQHLVWRARVTLDPAILFVQLDDQLLTVRRPLLPGALAAAERLAELLPAPRVSKRDASRVTPRARHPYVALDRTLEDLNHGRLRHEVVSRAPAHPETREALRVLQSLSLGETWALAALAKAARVTPEPPPVKPQLVKASA